MPTPSRTESNASNNSGYRAFAERTLSNNDYPLIARQGRGRDHRANDADAYATSSPRSSYDSRNSDKRAAPPAPQATSSKPRPAALAVPRKASSDGKAPDYSRWSLSSGGTSSVSRPAVEPDVFHIAPTLWTKNTDFVIASSEHAILHTYGLSDCTAIVALGGWDAEKQIFTRRTLVHLLGSGYDGRLVPYLKQQIFKDQQGEMYFISGTNPSLVDSQSGDFKAQLAGSNVHFDQIPTPKSMRGEVDVTPRGGIKVR